MMEGRFLYFFERNRFCSLKQLNLVKMNSKNKINLYQSIRDLKNSTAEKYYQIRIKTVQDPCRVFLRFKPYKILFILSHMRSGSSLLTHILNSNPEIIGYGETHINYASEANFKDLIFKVYWKMRDYQMQHKYVLDKILHTKKILNKSLLTSNNIRTIFLIREPVRSLNSILDLKLHWNEKKALDYYLERLAMLENYAKIINNKNHSLFITHEQLLQQTNLVFEKLKNFLDANEGFSEQYEILRTTGRSGIGDSSNNIKAGRILRESRRLDNKISQESIAKAMPLFNQCSETLSQYCSIVEC